MTSNYWQYPVITFSLSCFKSITKCDVTFSGIYVPETLCCSYLGEKELNMIIYDADSQIYMKTNIFVTYSRFLNNNIK